MIAIPAIDLREGACVQLVGGSYTNERVRLSDPVAVARRWSECGFRRLHVVDLDAATDAGDNASMIGAILDETDAEVQVGGGVRHRSRIEDLLAAGARRVILGTRAIENFDWLADVAISHPGIVVVAADVRDRRVVTHGWTRSHPMDVFDVLAELVHLPLAGVLVTAVHREGQMAGPDLALMEDLVEATDVPIIASGGVGSRDDLFALEHRGVSAVVIGMALYTGAVDPYAVAQEFAE
ncbi:MAG: 1-(5-phosphoribosyl)-5-[(5-phosphoribosylamino)methylideneamino]imidazole-4-carboxamide isomerase [Gemmatimonadaceae bacterium]|nr:MAG: 1-(5-phosphoribosyl)-5-((5-phosphoribosylamino)methylideneamino)imidazole-4-carboxamide isomerase [Gemmatimonadetes bacterium 21-71-4]